MPVRTALLQRAFETWIHADDIRLALLSAPHPPPPEHLTVLSDAGVRLLVTALGVARPAHAGRTVRIHLVGEGGGRWTLPVAAGTAAGPPDVTVRARGPRLLLPAGGTARPAARSAPGRRGQAPRRGPAGGRRRLRPRRGARPGGLTPARPIADRLGEAAQDEHAASRHDGGRREPRRESRQALDGAVTRRSVQQPVAGDADEHADERSASPPSRRRTRRRRRRRPTPARPPWPPARAAARSGSASGRRRDRCPRSRPAGRPRSGASAAPTVPVPVPVSVPVPVGPCPGPAASPRRRRSAARSSATPTSTTSSPPATWNQPSSRPLSVVANADSTAATASTLVVCASGHGGAHRGDLPQPPAARSLARPGRDHRRRDHRLAVPRRDCVRGTERCRPPPERPRSTTGARAVRRGPARRRAPPAVAPSAPLPGSSASQPRTAGAPRPPGRHGRVRRRTSGRGSAAGYAVSRPLTLRAGTSPPDGRAVAGRRHLAPADVRDRRDGQSNPSRRAAGGRPRSRALHAQQRQPGGAAAPDGARAAHPQRHRGAVAPDHDPPRRVAGTARAPSRAPRRRPAARAVGVGGPDRGEGGDLRQVLDVVDGDRAGAGRPRRRTCSPTGFPAGARPPRVRPRPSRRRQRRRPPTRGDSSPGRVS